MTSNVINGMPIPYGQPVFYSAGSDHSKKKGGYEDVKMHSKWFYRPKSFNKGELWEYSRRFWCDTPLC